MNDAAVHRDCLVSEPFGEQALSDLDAYWRSRSVEDEKTPAEWEALFQLRERRFNAWIKIIGTICELGVPTHHSFVEHLDLELDLLRFSPEWQQWWHQAGLRQLHLFLAFLADPPTEGAPQDRVRKSKGNLEVTKVYERRRWSELGPEDASRELRSLLADVAARRRFSPLPYVEGSVVRGI